MAAAEDTTKQAVRRKRRVALWGAPVALVVLVAALWLLLPMLNGHGEPAGPLKCGSNLRVIGEAMLRYAEHHQGNYPARLDQLVTEEGLDPEYLVCPESRGTTAQGATTREVVEQLSRAEHCSYVYLGMQLSVAERNAGRVAAYEAQDFHRQKGRWFLFEDGHVEFFAEPNAGEMMKRVGRGQNPPFE